MTRAVVTDTFLAEFGDLVRAANPGVTLLGMDADGVVWDGDVEVPRDEIRAEACFLSSDVYRDDRNRHVFGYLLHAEGVRFLQLSNAGVDHPVFGMLLDRGIRMCNAHITAPPIAEYVLAQVLAHRLPLAQWEADRADRRWGDREFPEVADSRWLVIGMGSIGGAVARLAQAFGAHVTGVRRTPGPDVIPPSAIVDALPDHDVVVLSTPATPETVGMVDATFLAAMPAGSMLVNVGRGTLVDQDALRAALDGRGGPALAILDVVDPEPLPADHWLWDHQRVVLTPHSSAAGLGRYRRGAELFAANLARWIAGDPLLDEVTTRD